MNCHRTPKAARTERLLPLLLFLVSGCASSGSDEGGNDAVGDGDGDGDSSAASGGEGQLGTGGEFTGAGGAVGASGGAVGAAGGAASGGSGPAASCGDLPPLELGPSIDCGSQGQIFADQGPHQNRINYVILGDGYTAEQLDTLYVDHIVNMLEHEDGMFGDLGEPYRTYENFINICALKVPSNDGCVDDLDTGLECDTPFGGYGDDASRLGIVDGGAVRGALSELMPPAVDVDWTAVTINAGANNWWNSGGSIMVWNGGFEPASRAASVALHEGGHAFHALADEYDGTSTNCQNANEVNVSTDSSGAKWSEWLGFDHDPGTGLHGSYEGARYCNTGVYRPTDNSEMNLLPDYFNMPSIQKMIHDFYAVVDPIDAHTENSAPLSNPTGLQIRVVDPDVLTIDWSVDGEVVSADAGECFLTDQLAPGMHTVTVRVYDETPWVRDAREDLEQSVSWDISID